MRFNFGEKMNYCSKLIVSDPIYFFIFYHWEHQIRDEIDLQRHVDYIHYNPVKHGLVRHVKDWPHSTFHKYVAKGFADENWGGYDEQGAFGE